MVTLGLAGRTLRAHVAGFVASFLALALGALLVTVCAGLLETGIRSDIPAQRLRTAPVLVTGVQDYRGEALAERDRLPGRVADQLAEVPGVARAVADVSFPVRVLEPGIRGQAGPLTGGPDVTGHGWSSARLTPFRLVSGRAPAGPGDVVVDAALAARLHLATGRALPVVADGKAVTLRVTGVAAAADAQAPSVFVTDARAQSLLPRPGRFDTVAVYPGPGVSAAGRARRVSRALPPGTALVLTGARRGRAEFPAAAGQSTDLIALASVSGGLMILVAVFIVASTLALSVQLRRRQIALLRAVGATPAQLRRMVLAETLLLAGPAAAAGVLPTWVAGRRLLAALAEHGLAASRLAYHQGVVATVTGAAIAVVTGLVAARVAAREAIRVRPVEALAAEDGPAPRASRARIAFGLLFLAGAVALALVTGLVFDGPVAASTAAPSAMLWAISLGLLGPVIARPVLWLPARIAAALAPRAGHVAMLTVRSRSARAAAMITPVMLATGLICALLYMQTAQQAASGHAYARQLRADLVIYAPGGLSPSVAAAAARLPGVRAVSPLVTSDGFVNVPRGANPDDVNDIPLEGISGAAAGQVTGFAVRTGSLAALRGNAIAIPSDQERPGRRRGDLVTVRFGDNDTARLRIVATVATARGYPVLLLPAALLAAHTTTGLASQVLVATDGNVTAAALQRAVRGVAPGAVVSGRPAALTAFDAGQQSGAWVSYLLIGALAAYTAVSLVNTTVASIARRRPQLRLLRLVGASRRQMARAMTIDAILVSVAGIALGTVVALATLLPFDRALGSPGLPAGPRWIYLAVAGTAAVLTIGVTQVATRLASTSPGRAG
jgi:putative ABC transport system permease protein